MLGQPSPRSFTLAAQEATADRQIGIIFRDPQFHVPLCEMSRLSCVRVRECQFNPSMFDTVSRCTNPYAAYGA